jgi:hypothetical protein
VVVARFSIVYGRLVAVTAEDTRRVLSHLPASLN